MPRQPRISTGGMTYHVLNRAVGRSRLFDDDADYLAMLRVIERTHKLLPVRIVAYCMMPNHWHLVLWPRADGELSEFMRLLTVTHTQRWHAHHRSSGTGPLYQGRFKSFPIEQDEHFLTACRYVERNAVRANLVRSATRWPWCSLSARESKHTPVWLLSTTHWPVDVPSNWVAYVNRAETDSELEALRVSVKRGRPFGDDRWQARTAKRMCLESTLRPRGRQRVRPIKDSRPAL
ncbi:MAG: transposase [Tepidisphaeraceae bacterium]